jgi:hypothetical protein
VEGLSVQVLLQEYWNEKNTDKPDIINRLAQISAKRGKAGNA